MIENPEENKKDNKIIERIEYLEQRISQLELLLGIKKVSHEEFLTKKNDLIIDNTKLKSSNVETESVMETKIGEFGLAWIGSIVLLFGMAFLTQYIQGLGQPLFSTIFGYIAATIVFYISYKLKNSFYNLSDKFYIISHVLVYYVTLRLYYYTSFPLFSIEAIPLILLLIISAVHVFISFKRKSELFGAISLILLIVTAFISSYTQLSFSLITITSLISMYFVYKYQWWKQFFLFQLLTYLFFLFWYLNNQTNLPNVLPSDNYSLAYLLVIVSTFSFITLIKQSEIINNVVVFISVITNGFLFSFSLALYVLTYYITNYIGVFASISLICLLFSVLLKKYSDWKFTPAFYALYGFVTMSISVYGICGMPLVFLLLSIQSLLVVSMAIWFKSRIIVVMNFFLFISLLATYLFTSSSINGINFSFATVSLISARVINWKKERLEIQTELLRDLYLIIAFFTVLYALYIALPSNYITLSWAIAAIVYFIASLLLKNNKYRLMSIFTMLAATFYLFIVDLAVIDTVYRILAFMFVAIISIAISVFYSKRKKKNIE
ncbi:MAG: hypothetical protein A2X08_15535 [Bacteroidetes bacterium GWA2_32_17]|nr:MAG: hypothetical protein A2X08_15535 [Bacteroidetes bacterium GWA2_32_17]